MTPHDQFEGLLPRLATGELGGAEERRMRRHLEGCGECQAWLETWSLFSHGLSPAGAEPGHPSSDQLARLAVDRDLLAPSELEVLDEHVGSCAECRRAVELSGSALTGGRRPRKVAAAFRWLSPAALPMPARVALAAGLVVAAALVFTPRRLPEMVTTIDHEIVDSVLTGPQLIQAEGSITARAVRVEEGGEVTLQAGETVILENGFTVGSGASLKVVAGRTKSSQEGEPTVDVG